MWTGGVSDKDKEEWEADGTGRASEWASTIELMPSTPSLFQRQLREEGGVVYWGAVA